MNIKAIPILIILICSSHANALNYISNIVKQNGISYCIPETLLTNDSPLIFSLKDESPKGSWHFLYMDRDNNWQESSSGLTSHGNTCILSIQSTNWFYAENYYDEEQNKNYFLCKIIYKINDTEIHELCFRLAILPDRPTIKDIHFDISYEWDCDPPQFKESLLKINVIHGKTERLHLCLTNNMYYHSSERPEMFNYAEDLHETSDTDNGCDYYEIKDLDWGECFAIRALNKYGSVMGDTLNTTDFVNDPNMTDYICNYWNKQSKLNDLKQDNSDIIFSNGIISCPRIYSITIYTISGRTINEFKKTETININDLPKGLYLISYTHKDGNYKTIKYLKP